MPVGYQKGSAYALVYDLSSKGIIIMQPCRYQEICNCEDKDLVTQKPCKLFDLSCPQNECKELNEFRVTISSTLKAIGTHKFLDSADWVIIALIQRKLSSHLLDQLYKTWSKLCISHIKKWKRA